MYDISMLSALMLCYQTCYFNWLAHINKWKTYCVIEIIVLINDQEQIILRQGLASKSILLVKVAFSVLIKYIFDGDFFSFL